MFESWIADFLAAAGLLFTIIYYYLTATHDHWKKINVSYIKPTFPFGNFSKALTGKVSFPQVFQDFYPVFKKEGFGGVFNVREPVLVVCDPELIKQFLTKDFVSFHDRGIPCDEENDPFSANLFNLSGQRWKTLRAKLSPTFTSGKIKGMFPLIQECSQELKMSLQNEIKKGRSIEMKDWLTRYTVDVIGTCAFGVSCNSLRDPNAEFYQMGREVFKSSFLKIVRYMIISLCPLLTRFFTFKSLFSKTTEFFTGIMDRTVRYRRENNIQRNDFVQLMMKIIDEESEDMPFNQNTMTAQAFLFFIAGLDNIYNNVGFCLHALAVNPDLQEKVYQEIMGVLKKCEGKMCYEAIGKMDLLCRVIDEGLRMYTPSGVLVRKQTDERYFIPGTDIELRRGSTLMFPTQCIHYDETYFSNPQIFDPDRFLEEEKAKRHPYAYLPFGEGPRFCIASRFAQLEMRLCLAELVRNFKFSVASETDLSLSLDVKYFGPTPKNGFWFQLEERM